MSCRCRSFPIFVFLNARSLTTDVLLRHDMMTLYTQNKYFRCIYTCDGDTYNLIPVTYIHTCCIMPLFSWLYIGRVVRVPIKINFVGSSLTECTLVRRDFFLHIYTRYVYNIYQVYIYSARAWDSYISMKIDEHWECWTLKCDIKNKGACRAVEGATPTYLWPRLVQKIADGETSYELGW